MQLDIKENRVHLASISYSVNEIYEFVADGINHFISPKFAELKYSDDGIDTLLVEGEGSDYIFFEKTFGSKLSIINPTSFGDLKSAGKASVVKMLDLDYELLRGKNILLLVDYCAFGSNISDLINLCEAYGLKVGFVDKYKSFEYLLLRSKLIDDSELDSFMDEYRLKYNSLENLFTERLLLLTSNQHYKYSKSKSEFPNCYYDDCCHNKDNKGNCDKRIVFGNKDKKYAMLEGTEFEDILRLLERE